MEPPAYVNIEPEVPEVATRKQTKHSNQPADLKGAPLDARPRVKRARPIKDEKDLSSEMAEEGKLGRERHFDVDRILEEAAERRLNRSITFERLSEAFGTQDTDFVWGVTQQLIDAGASFNYGEAIGFLLSVIRDIKPRDHVERLLAAQMSSIHLAMMHFTENELRTRTFRSTYPNGTVRYERSRAS